MIRLFWLVKRKCVRAFWIRQKGLEDRCTQKRLQQARQVLAHSKQLAQRVLDGELGLLETTRPPPIDSSNRCSLLISGWNSRRQAGMERGGSFTPGLQ